MDCLEIERELPQEINAEKWYKGSPNLGGLRMIGMHSKRAEEGKVKSKRKPSAETCIVKS